MNDDQLAGLVADLDSLAALWQRAATVTDPRYGPHDAGYDAALKLCARQLRQALQDALAQAGDEPVPYVLAGCTCGGVGNTGSHRPGCIWAAS